MFFVMFDLFSFVMFGLFFYVMFGLEPDISFTDSRVKHGNDRGEEKRPAMTKRKISMNMTEEKK